MSTHTKFFLNYNDENKIIITVERAHETIILRHNLQHNYIIAQKL